MEIVRLEVLTEAARALVEEYYAAVGVVARDSAAALREMVEDAAGGMWVALSGGEAAGCVVLRPLREVTGVGECKRLYVREGWRGAGVGDALMDALEAYARDVARYGWVYLDSKDDLRAALALYARRGYQPCERYNANPQATVFLRKRMGGEVRKRMGGEDGR